MTTRAGSSCRARPSFVKRVVVKASPRWPAAVRAIGMKAMRVGKAVRVARAVMVAVNNGAPKAARRACRRALRTVIGAIEVLAAVAEAGVEIEEIVVTEAAAAAVVVIAADAAAVVVIAVVEAAGIVEAAVGANLV